MKEHEAGCPRSQFWDAGEYQAPCLCGEKTKMKHNREFYHKLAADVDEILDSLKDQQISGAINWVDLHCDGITECNLKYPMGGEQFILITIAEADPGAVKLHDAVLNGLFERGYKENFQVETNW